MTKYYKIHNLISKYSTLGTKITDDGTYLVGNPDNKKPYFWINKVYRRLTEEQIKEFEEKYELIIPNEYKEFLMEFGNGISILTGTMSLYGYRYIFNRNLDTWQPFSLKTINIDERPKNSKESFFFIGGYDWDGSHLYIDKETSKVHFCSRYDATSLITWNSLVDMLESEISRLYGLFNDRGEEIDEDKTTLPI